LVTVVIVQDIPSKPYEAVFAIPVEGFRQESDGLPPAPEEVLKERALHWFMAELSSVAKAKKYFLSLRRVGWVPNFTRQSAQDFNVFYVEKWFNFGSVMV